MGTRSPVCIHYPVFIHNSSSNIQILDNTDAVQVVVRGLISKFAVGCGRTGTDRQFFYINGRPCNLSKVRALLILYVTDQC